MVNFFYQTYIILCIDLVINFHVRKILFIKSYNILNINLTINLKCLIKLFASSNLFYLILLLKQDVTKKN